MMIYDYKAIALHCVRCLCEEFSSRAKCIAKLINGKVQSSHLWAQYRLLSLIGTHFISYFFGFQLSFIMEINAKIWNDVRLAIDPYVWFGS